MAAQDGRADASVNAELKTIFLTRAATEHWTQLARLLADRVRTQGLPFSVQVEGEPCPVGAKNTASSKQGSEATDSTYISTAQPSSAPHAEGAAAEGAGETAQGMAWLVSLGSNLSAELFERHRPQRVVVAHAGIPTQLASLDDVPPIFNVHHNSKATGETAIALMLGLQRRLIVADRACRVGDWTPKKTLAKPNSGCTSSAYNSTVVVLGYGAVGQYICKVLRALGSTVLAVRRSARSGGEHGEHADAVHPPADLAHLLPRAKTLIVATPLTAETQGLVGASMLGALPDYASVVNVGRAAVVDEDAIWKEASSGRLGFASDVWWEEGGLKAALAEGKPFFGSKHPFHTLDNVVMTPHYAGGVGLDGIEDARADAVIATILEAEAGTRKPCDLQLGY